VRRSGLLLLLAGCATSPAPPGLVDRGPMPARVHVAEDFETDLERRWWLAGAVVADGPGRACKGTSSKDFDDKMGDPAKRYAAVIFNPVPGPPMGPSTRLAFRYRLRGSDTLRVQLFSLSNNYHRRLVLPGLPQGEWRQACVDMTLLRRPDGSGGPLSENERIDDIQFYTDPAAELWIDDIVLFDAGPGPEPFPGRVVFAGGFDTGAQGKEWPGDFDIVPHEKPRTWKFARAKNGRLRVDLRGERPAKDGRVRVQVRRRGPARLSIGASTLDLDGPEGAWALHDLPFRSAGSLREATFTGDVDVDDLLIYEP
jgi:hypothetical protein